jgi:hypothetical protein
MLIDDRISKIQEIIGPHVEDPMRTFIDEELTSGLIVGGAFFSPILAVVAAVRRVLSTQDRDGRLRAAMRAMCEELYSIRESLPSNAEEALRGKWFSRATRIVIEEAARAEDEDKAVLLALVTVYGCFPDDANKHRQEDLASYIKDLAKLGVEDIRMLKLLEESYKSAVAQAPHLNMADMFSQNYDAFKRSAHEQGFNPDDCISLGARLSGFGLSYEAPRTTTRQSPMESFFRPTLRGLYLLSLLRKAEEKMAARPRA